jgi:nitric oxide synthase oxygenase domain/subunit
MNEVSIYEKRKIQQQRISMTDKLEKTLAFWKFEAKSGKKGIKTTAKYDVLIPAGSKALIMANEFKRNSQDPDYYLFISRPDTQEQLTLTPTPEGEDLPF